MITVQQYATITDAASALIGRSSLLYFGAKTLHAAAIESHVEDMDDALRRIADALGYDVTKKGEPAKATEWAPIKTAPRDRTWVWLFNKHNEEPIRLFWSTNYSVFGLGGCWTDGFCTMGDGIDFDFWCPVLPADYVNPHHTAPAVAAAE